VVTCPSPPVFARPNILVASCATQAKACILSDHNIFYTARGRRGRRGNAPGAFLVGVKTAEVKMQKLWIGFLWWETPKNTRKLKLLCRQYNIFNEIDNLSPKTTRFGVCIIQNDVLLNDINVMVNPECNYGYNLKRNPIFFLQFCYFILFYFILFFQHPRYFP